MQHQSCMLAALHLRQGPVVQWALPTVAGTYPLSAILQHYTCIGICSYAYVCFACVFDCHCMSYVLACPGCMYDGVRLHSRLRFAACTIGSPVLARCACLCTNLATHGCNHTGNFWQKFPLCTTVAFCKLMLLASAWPLAAAVRHHGHAHLTCTHAHFAASLPVAALCMCHRVHMHVSCHYMIDLFDLTCMRMCLLHGIRMLD